MNRKEIAVMCVSTPQNIPQLETTGADVPLEDEEQRVVKAYLDAREYRDIAQGRTHLLWTHPANENASARARRVAAELGTKPGVPDLLFFNETLFGHPGAAIELKRRKGSKTKPEQKVWIAALAARGRATAVCKGAASAIQMIVHWYGP